MKKLILVVLAALCLICPTINVGGKVCYAEPTDESAESALKEETVKQLQALDLSDLENSFEDANFADGACLEDFLTQVIDGNLPLNFSTIMGFVNQYIKENIKNVIGFIITIIAICFLSALFTNLQSPKMANGMGGTVSAVFLIVLVLLISYRVIDSITGVVKSINSVGNVLNSAFPIIFALMATLGATKSSAIFKPTVVVFTSVILKIFSTVIVSLIVAYFICVCLGNLTPNFKLEKIKKFIVSLIKTIIGVVFTVFMAYLSLQGITSATADGISIKTTKYAIKNYVPVVGGYFADGFEIFKAGSLLIKNSVGVVSLLIIFFSCLGLVVNLIVMNLCLKLASGVSEPFSSGGVNNFISGVSEVFKYLLATVLVVFMMAFIIIILVLLSASNIL